MPYYTEKTNKLQVATVADMSATRKLPDKEELNGFDGVHGTLLLLHARCGHLTLNMHTDK